MLMLEIDLEFHKEKKHEDTEVLNVRNKTCQEVFYQFTSKDTRFIKCFSKDENINVQFNKWKRHFNKAINACFKNIKLKENKSNGASKIDKLIDEKKEILRKKEITHEEYMRVENIEIEISNQCEGKELEKLERVMDEIETNKTNIWREMRKAFPNKTKPIPTGVKDIKGRVITNPTERKEVTLNHFDFRMRKRPIVEDVREIVELQDDLFKIRLVKAQKNKSPPFTRKELDIVLKSLKKGKSKDPDNYICELFKEGVIEKDLNESILLMMNRIKKKMEIPQCLTTANITILHKNKCKLDLNNWRGIYVSSVLRTILMKLVHGRTYEVVNKNMTDGQIGARKNKSGRNHLFILNSVLSDVMSSVKKTPIDLTIMDFNKCSTLKN